VALAHKALTISPLCADAYVLLAEEQAKSAEEALEYYRKGVEAAEQVRAQRIQGICRAFLGLPRN